MTERYELPRTRGVEMAADGRRRLRVMAGEGMVTPKARMTWRDPYRGLLTFEPGHDRLCPSHPAVYAEPLNFRAAWDKDVATRLALVNTQERYVKRGGRTRADVTARGSTPLWLTKHGRTRRLPAGRPRLGKASLSNGREKWRLGPEPWRLG